MPLPSASPEDGIRFGVFQVHTRSGELRKHGIRIKLQDQPFKILLALLEKPGEVVTREELRQRIWGDDTFVDFDHGLSAAVNRLREALNDSAEKPRYVETLARRGYRFIASVEGLAGPAAAAPAPAPAPAPAARMSRRKLAWVAAALLVSVGAVTALWLARPRAAPRPPQVVPLTTYPGSELQPSLSPDGKQVAFTWDGEKQDNTDLYVKMVGSGTPLRLTTDPAPDQDPAWSPDGRQLAFVRQRGGQASVFLISPLGGSERKLTDFLPAASPALSWSPDGKWLALAERGPPGTNGIFLIPVERGEKRRLTSNSVDLDHAPAFSPDGRFLACASCTGLYSCEVRLLELGPGPAPKAQPRSLTHQGGRISGIAWTADGRSVVYSASRNAGSSPYLWRISVSGSAEPERLELAGFRASYPTIPRAGNRLAYAQGGPDVDIWRLDDAAAAKNFISSTLRDDSPQFSPDGTRIAFASNRSGGGSEVWICGRDGSNLVQLTNGLGRHQGTPRWSPDSRFIVFDSQGEDGHWDIYLIDAAGGQPRRMTTDPSDEFIASFSRDGEWIYFASDRSGRLEIRRIPARGGKGARVTNNGGFVAYESWDGKTLYYTKAGAGRFTWGPYPLFAQSAAGGSERQVLDAVIAGAFFPVEDGIYYIANAGPDRAYPLLFFDIATGKSRVLTRIEAQPHSGLSVSPDRKTVLFSVPKPINYDLMLIENFR